MTKSAKVFVKRDAINNRAFSVRRITIALHQVGDTAYKKEKSNEGKTKSTKA